VLEHVQVRNAPACCRRPANARVTGLRCAACSAPALTAGRKTTVVASPVSGGDSRPTFHTTSNEAASSAIGSAAARSTCGQK
jgi:hypothetical protein